MVQYFRINLQIDYSATASSSVLPQTGCPRPSASSASKDPIVFPRPNWSQTCIWITSSSSSPYLAFIQINLNHPLPNYKIQAFFHGTFSANRSFRQNNISSSFSPPINYFFKLKILIQIYTFSSYFQTMSVWKWLGGIGGKTQ